MNNSIEHFKRKNTIYVIDYSHNIKYIGHLLAQSIFILLF